MKSYTFETHTTGQGLPLLALPTPVSSCQTWPAPTNLLIPLQAPSSPGQLLPGPASFCSPLRAPGSSAPNYLPHPSRSLQGLPKHSKAFHDQSLLADMPNIAKSKPISVSKIQYLPSKTSIQTRPSNSSKSTRPFIHARKGRRQRRQPLNNCIVCAPWTCFATFFI